MLLRGEVNLRPPFGWELISTYVPYSHNFVRCMAVSDKQVALLISVVSAVVLSMSGAALYAGISAKSSLSIYIEQANRHQEIIDRQTAEIKQLTANQITLAAMMVPPLGDPLQPSAVNLGAARDAVDSNTGVTQSIDQTASQAAAPDQTETIPPKTVDLPPQTRPIPVNLMQPRKSEPQASLSPTIPGTILAALENPLTSPRSHNSAYRVKESSLIEAVPATTQPALESLKTTNFENVDSLLVQRIISNWKRPTSARNGMSVEIVIKMARNGDIKQVRVARSSGDKAFDQSAADAIKAVKSVPEVANVKSTTYDSLYKERRISFSPENLSG